MTRISKELSLSPYVINKIKNIYKPKFKEIKEKRKRLTDDTKEKRKC